MRVSTHVDKFFPEFFSNLLDNAVKYTREEGTIQAKISSVQREVDGTIREFVEVVVSDSGVGISKQELPKEFYTGKTSQHKTTGLGLALCRSIIEAHNGMITADSVVGRGSTFKFNLPVDSF